MGGQVNLGKISKRTVCFQQNLALDNAIAPIFKAFVKNLGALHRCAVGDGFTLKLAGPDAAHGLPHFKDKTVAIIFFGIASRGAPCYYKACRSVSSVPEESG